MKLLNGWEDGLFFTGLAKLHNKPSVLNIVYSSEQTRNEIFEITHRGDCFISPPRPPTLVFRQTDRDGGLENPSVCPHFHMLLFSRVGSMWLAALVPSPHLNFGETPSS